MAPAAPATPAALRLGLARLAPRSVAASCTGR